MHSAGILHSILADRTQQVAIVSGVHEGMYGCVLSIELPNVLVKFENDEVVDVPKSDVIAVDPTTHLSISHANGSARESKKRKLTVKTPTDTSEACTKRKNRQKRNIWVTQHILVRIVSKRFEGGRYYRKKARIVDVVSEDVCVLMLENGKLLEGVSQDMLETVLPEPGGIVLILMGTSTGEKATLIEKSTSKGTAVVQLQHDLSLLNCDMDDVSAFAPSEG